ncbi:MAG: hypothetical protein ACRD2D_12125 [Terriglobales bacterium]
MNRKLSHSGKHGYAHASLPGDAPGAATTTLVNPAEVIIACAEFQEILAQVLERDDLPLPARLHLSDCSACEAMLHDFEIIAQRVRNLLPQEMDAVPDQWPQIRFELLREGIIHSGACPDAALPPAQPKLVQHTSTPRRVR